MQGISCVEHAVLAADIKALARSAQTRMMDQSHLYGAGAKAGVARPLSQPRAEIVRDMGLPGVTHIDPITGDDIRERRTV